MLPRSSQLAQPSPAVARCWPRVAGAAPTMFDHCTRRRPTLLAVVASNSMAPKRKASAPKEAAAKKSKQAAAPAAPATAAVAPGAVVIEHCRS